MTSSIAYGFVPEEAVTMRGVNNCFQAAMFAGLIFSTVTKGEHLFAVEAFLTLIFCMGGTCSGDLPPEVQTAITNVTSRDRFRFADYGASTTGGLIRFMLNLGFCAYGVWFTFKGMDGMQHTPCSTYAFFFARVNLFNWYRVLLKIVFCLGIILYGVFVMLGTPYMAYVGYQYFAKKEYKEEKTEEDNKSTTAIAPTATTTGAAVGPVQSPMPVTPTTSTESLPPNAPFSENDEEKESQNAALSLENLGMSGVLVFFVITVELMIKWNRIAGVNTVKSTGQLLPLIIGIGGLFRVLHRLVVKLLKKHL